MLLEKIRHNRLTNATECLLAQAINLVCDLFLKQEEEATNKEGRGVHDLTAYIASDVGRNFDLSELARMTLLNRTKLNRLFKEVYGCTVFEFIRRERLHRAENWLSQTDMSITDIAYAAGFCSSSHFCRCFHQIYGNPPKNFRSCIRTR
jgi:transcriptional regulator GlxA family with amidase domain